LFAEHLFAAQGALWRQLVSLVGCSIEMPDPVLIVDTGMPAVRKCASEAQAGDMIGGLVLDDDL
jgi:hypothetical protein